MSTVKPPLADVEGKVAFITGGSSGIGLGIARACAAAGMKVAFTYRREDHRDEALRMLGMGNAAVHAFELDVTDREAFARVADDAERALGPVSLLVNNAGIGIRAGAAEASYADWDWGLDVNLGGVVNGLVTWLPRLRERARAGEPVHVAATASTSGLVAGGKHGVYVTAKFAVVGLMEALRDELSGENVGVSVFCPGFVQSNLVETEKGRPAAFANTLAKPSTTPPTPQEEAMLRKFGAVGMDAGVAGELFLAGVRRNDLHIITHAEFAAPVRERMEALLAAFPAEKPPAARATLAKRFLSDIYTRPAGP